LSNPFGSFLRRVFIYGDNPLINSYRENYLRPPGAVEEERFMALCIRCNRCLEVCPYDSIERAGWGPTLGTPYVLPEAKACYLCMACTRLCPTSALDTRLKNPENVRMGKARIDFSICYSHLFLEHDTLPENAGAKIGALCNTCYNVCPFPDKAIKLRDNLFPVVTDECVGCGICVERCPVRPRRAVNIVPTGMGRVDRAGFYYRKARKFYETSLTPGRTDPSKVLKGKDLLDKKQRIQGGGERPKFHFPYESPADGEEWE